MLLKADILLCACWCTGSVLLWYMVQPAAGKASAKKLSASSLEKTSLWIAVTLAIPLNLRVKYKVGWVYFAAS